MVRTQSKARVAPAFQNHFFEYQRAGAPSNRSSLWAQRVARQCWCRNTQMGSADSDWLSIVNLCKVTPFLLFRHGVALAGLAFQLAGQRPESMLPHWFQHDAEPPDIDNGVLDNGIVEDGVDDGMEQLLPNCVTVTGLQHTVHNLTQDTNQSLAWWPVFYGH